MALLLATACGGSGASADPAAAYLTDPAPDLGWVIIQNHSALCYDCVEIVQDGVSMGPSGGQADGMYENGSTYEITMWSSVEGAVWTFPPFLLDGEEVLVIE